MSLGRIKSKPLLFAADSYYEQTAGVYFNELYERSLQYVPDGGRLMDISYDEKCRYMRGFAKEDLQTFIAEANTAEPEAHEDNRKKTG